MDKEAKVEKRKKFLERNRIATDRSLERKKAYISNMETKQRNLIRRNQFLRRDMNRLTQEVYSLRNLAAFECDCENEKLEANLRAVLKETAGSPDDVEEVVGKVLHLRAKDLGMGGGREVFPLRLSLRGLLMMVSWCGWGRSTRIVDLVCRVYRLMLRHRRGS